MVVERLKNLAYTIPVSSEKRKECKGMSAFGVFRGPSLWIKRFRVLKEKKSTHCEYWRDDWFQGKKKKKNRKRPLPSRYEGGGVWYMERWPHGYAWNSQYDHPVCSLGRAGGLSPQEETLSGTPSTPVWPTHQQHFCIESLSDNYGQDLTVNITFSTIFRYLKLGMSSCVGLRLSPSTLSTSAKTFSSMCLFWEIIATAKLSSVVVVSCPANLKYDAIKLTSAFWIDKRWIHPYRKVLMWSTILDTGRDPSSESYY